MREVAAVFLKLGLIGFGGPVAHLALMEEEVVERRKWITREHFLDLVGLTNLIPGPNSTEMAIHLGYRRAGWSGLVAGGTAFILPAFLIVLGIAALYARYGTTPTAEALLYGIQPVVIAIVAQAVWGLGRTALRSWLPALVAGAAFAGYFLGAHELLLLFGGGLLVMLLRNARQLGAAASGAAAWPLGTVGIVAALQSAVPVTLTGLFLNFLKIGAVLYGSGYVLVAFLQSEFVERLGWISSAQLLDAVAIGQFTPGPVFTTATFIGYLVAGVPGAVVATVGIFLPAFVFVAISHPFIPRLRRSPWLGALLDGVVAASLGLMAAVTVDLARAALVDWVTVVVALAAAVLLIRFRVNSTWLIIGGAVVGLLSSMASR